MDALINMDVHDASLETQDGWIFYRHSITQDGMAREPVGCPFAPNFSQLVNTGLPAYFPAYESGGIGGLLSGDGATRTTHGSRSFRVAMSGSRTARTTRTAA